MHWANVTAAPLRVHDWENWGRLPVGYDIGLLHAYSLAVPSVAARIREEFADVLDTPTGRAGELIALAQRTTPARAGTTLPDLGCCRVIMLFSFTCFTTVPGFCWWVSVKCCWALVAPYSSVWRLRRRMSVLTAR
ncbi:hypothetical protein GCM10010387_49970 [Streptomyces inusitatus]|uniref:Uncharacterized protein n=1 Tax=Streptomyces inusitatus TaxID=68221 RepID=A0A918QH71_9ACTN|nr:hypothetical protein GCM10010387_49970 [Streptomyces inusitatus]